jgi:hypothetical protein
VNDTYRMIEDAGFEVDGNPEYAALRAARREAPSGFRLVGGDGEILRPEVRRGA